MGCFCPSRNVGVVHLRKHLDVLCAFMRAATTWDAFVQMVERAYPKPGDQLRLFNLNDWPPSE